MNRHTILRAAIAVGSIVGGAIHLQLYLSVYRDLPIENLGRSFVLNAIAANATLIAFGLSRTDRGIMGFTERGCIPTPEAAASVSIEIATACLCIVALLLPREPTDENTFTTPPG